MSAAPPVAPLPAGKSETTKPIILISYPKIVLLYPTFIAAMIAGLVSLVYDTNSPHSQTIGVLFMGLLTMNIVVLAVDFPRTTSLNLFFVGVVLGLTTLLASIYYPNLMPNVTAILRRIDPRANAAFYFCFVAMLSVLYIGVLINVRFDYWEVRPNELLHHHGFLSNVERYPAPNVRISKEIDPCLKTTHGIGHCGVNRVRHFRQLAPNNLNLGVFRCGRRRFCRRFRGGQLRTQLVVLALQRTYSTLGGAQVGLHGGDSGENLADPGGQSFEWVFLGLGGLILGCRGGVGRHRGRFSRRTSLVLSGVFGVGRVVGVVRGFGASVVSKGGRESSIGRFIRRGAVLFGEVCAVVADFVVVLGGLCVHGCLGYWPCGQRC